MQRLNITQEVILKRAQNRDLDALKRDIEEVPHDVGPVVSRLAFEGRFELVKAILKMAPQYKNDALIGYAQNDNGEALKLISGDNVNYALAGYAAGGHISRVQQLVKKYKESISFNNAIKGFEQAGYFKTLEKSVELINQFNSTKERNALIKHAKQMYPKIESMLPKTLDATSDKNDKPSARSIFKFNEKNKENKIEKLEINKINKRHSN